MEEGVEEVMHVGCTTTHLDKRSVVRSLDLSRRGVDEEGEGRMCRALEVSFPERVVLA